MPKAKIIVWIEIACDILHKVNSALCRDKKIEQAERLQEIIRQLYVFSRDLRRNRQHTITDETMIALHKLGEQTHENSRDTTV